MTAPPGGGLAEVETVRDATWDILLIEDNPADVRLVTEALTSAGAGPVRVAAEPLLSTGLSRLTTQTFDAVVLDLALPDSGVLNTLERVRRHAPRIPIVVLTGHADLVAAGTDRRADAVLIKGQADGPALWTALSRAITRPRWASRAAAEPWPVGALDMTDQVLWQLAAKGQWLEGLAGAVDALYGLPPDALLARPALWRATVHREDRPRFADFLDEAQGRGHAELEHRVLHADGQERLVVSRARRLHGSPFIEGVSTDVTQLRRLEAERRQAQRDETIGRLAAGVAHDFNNMLTVMWGRSELLLASADLPDSLRHDAALIARTAERAQRLTRQMLDFTRASRPGRARVDLNRILEDLVDMLRALLGETVSLDLRPSPYLDAIDVDRGQIEQVIMNLAVNARDAMPDGGGLTIATTAIGVGAALASRLGGLTPDPYVALSVTDTGHGMSPEVLARIFEPFFTTKPAGRGTGLGLSVVKGIVLQTGGALDVTSEPGRGTRVTVYLPAIDPTAAPATPLPARARTGSETILVVDDEPDLRCLAREILESTGYTVIECGDGNSALIASTACAGPIHLVLSDVAMPGLSGTELAHRLRAARPDVRVLLMSGWHQQLVNSTAGTAWPLLRKPFTPAGLLDAIREQLDA